MKLTQTAAQNLVKQGATFEGRSLIFKRPQELSAEKALKRMAKGRPVEAVVEDERFPIKQDSDLVELNFFRAQGSDEGLQDAPLAHCLRDLKFNAISPYPMKAYQTLMKPEGRVTVSHPDLYNQTLNRDGMLALGYFNGVLDEPDCLAFPEKARSLKLLKEADLLEETERPARLYTERDQGMFLNHNFVSKRRLDDSQQIARVVRQIQGIRQLGQQFEVNKTGINEIFEKAAWEKQFDLERCEQLLRRFTPQPEGIQKLARLVKIGPQDQLPGQTQAAQFEEMLRTLPENTPVHPDEFAWLTSDADSFESRLSVLKSAKELTCSGQGWKSHSGADTLVRLEDPQRLAFLQNLAKLAPLDQSNFELASRLEPEQYSQFAYVYEEAARAEVKDLAGVWADVSPSWSDTYQKLTADGLDPARAVLAASALGADPARQMLEMAGQLKLEKGDYASNDYVQALKLATGLQSDEQRDFCEIFSAQDLRGFQHSWRLTEEYGRSNAGYREVLKVMKVCGMSHHRFDELRSSGASAASLLANLRETPEEKALRAQRWVAYTARQLTRSQAAVAGFSGSLSAQRQRQAQELKDMDHWYVPSQSYYQTLDNQREQNKWNSRQSQSLSQTAREWDLKMARLQSGQIPWGEPPST